MLMADCCHIFSVYSLLRIEVGSVSLIYLVFKFLFQVLYFLSLNMKYILDHHSISSYHTCSISYLISALFIYASAESRKIFIFGWWSVQVDLQWSSWLMLVNRHWSLIILTDNLCKTSKHLLFILCHMIILLWTFTNLFCLSWSSYNGGAEAYRKSFERITPNFDIFLEFWQRTSLEAYQGNDSAGLLCFFWWNFFKFGQPIFYCLLAFRYCEIYKYVI